MPRLTASEYKAKCAKLRQWRLETLKKHVEQQALRRKAKASRRKLRAEHQRRAKVRRGRLGATALEEFSQVQLGRRIKMLGERCLYCGGPYQHLDHLVPVAAGGRHALWNLAPSCRACNTSKGDSDPIAWVEKRAINKIAVLLVARAVQRHTRKVKVNAP